MGPKTQVSNKTVQGVADKTSKLDNKGPSPQDKKQAEQEASTSAKKAISAQDKAKELTQAAAGAGDPDERQKLLNEALQQQIEAENFGKAAKYLQSGTFQGLLAGTGMGGGIGATLGLIVTSVLSGVTGVVGGGVGAAAGAINGPFFNVAESMGGAIKKVTGNLPGWKATTQQKQALEKMVNGVKDTEKPGADELKRLSEGGGAGGPGDDGSGGGEKTWTHTASQYVPGKDALSSSMPGWGSNKEQESNGAQPAQAEAPQASQANGNNKSEKTEKPKSVSKPNGGNASSQQKAPDRRPSQQKAGGTQNAPSESSTRPETQAPRRSSRSVQQSPAPAKQAQASPAPAKRAPTQPTPAGTNQSKATKAQPKQAQEQPPKKKPRKLEVRSE